LRALREPDCDVIDPWDAGCNQTVEGFVEEGGGCFEDGECARNLKCVREDSESCGTCRYKAWIGEPCTVSLSCALGLQCAFGAGGLVCRETRPLDGSCDETSFCAGATYCPSNGGVCTRPQRENEPCSTLLHCDTRNNLECLSRVCRARVWSQKGEPCNTEQRCARGLRCDPENGCADFPRAGEMCGPAGCADSFCGSQNTCTALGTVGALCDPQSFSCGDQLQCLRDNGEFRCTAWRLCE
jgi:hypothetical protein